MVPDQAWDIWEQAAAYLEQQNVSERDLRNAASLLLMAIEASPVPFPEAHALLSLTYEKLKDEKAAVQHANTALQSDPYNYMAQSVKVRVALINLKAFNAGAFLKSESWLDVLIGGVAYKKTGDTQNNLRKELEKWLEIFSILSQQQDYTCRDYLWMGNEIIEIIDIIPAQKTGLVDIVKKAYSVISTVNIGVLPFEDAQEQLDAKKLNLLAKGRLRL